MRNMADTIARLKALQRRLPSAGDPIPSSRLSPFGWDGSNPGALRAYTHVPELLPERAPLVVVLHGCTQTAAGYDYGSGWSQLADRHGFALLCPEQQRANNPNLCFNWFVPEDVRRDSGEALSIAQMVQMMTEIHRLDRRRVFITGLSAGGAMACAMLATYPDLFAGGAIIAGLPFRCASSVPEALDRMRGHGQPPVRSLEALVRGASRHAGPWPTLSLWHGSADHTVAPGNMDAIIAQWRGIHGLLNAQPERNSIGPHSRRLWRDEAGIAKIEAVSVAGMGHGTPLSRADEIGNPGAFMLDAGISSTRHIARFWQLIGTGTELSHTIPSGNQRTEPASGSADGASGPPFPQPSAPASGVGKVIEDALRVAGLMR
ncbi:alpha/beta hydrolase family esterase [Bosea sp. BH3]|uniref:extracellular catalytic domain type 1 short-chain-length polyhydroxyalkanoate depolymerase n=1 Tax=Bosea sp. BH3 TaxID=2871701 RepID=UPI0021CB516E|nr:PHB depolymerase family esterase [Bosea sp. BH3]MCU4179670.1 PHB depolymerase family esterase [Bosea sp. BH3]